MTQHVRAQLTQVVRASDIPKDFCDHTMYFWDSTGGVPLAQADWDALADAILKCFSGPWTGTNPWNAYAGRRLEMRLYDMADPVPRPERSMRVYTPGTPESAPLGPRQVALCLSFFAVRNLPSQRGRLYLGPWDATDLSETPGANFRGRALDLAARFQAIGQANIAGASWDHAAFSEKQGIYRTVTDYWVNDVWDTQRRRLAKETIRDKHNYP